MSTEERAVLLRIFVSEHEKRGARPLFEEIVLAAKERRLAGATVLKGILGYGASFHLHAAKLVELSNSLPIVIEIVDREERIDEFMAYLDEVVGDGFVTREYVRVNRYRKNPPGP